MISTPAKNKIGTVLFFDQPYGTIVDHTTKGDHMEPEGTITIIGDHTGPYRTLGDQRGP